MNEQMKSASRTVVLGAPKSKVFAFLSEPQNLPKWATGFCRELISGDDGLKLVTPQGEIFFRMETDEDSGVIDMYGGPAPDQMAYFPTRVVDLPGGGSAYTFTNIQWPGISDDDFKAQCAGLSEEFENIRRLTEAA